MPAPIPILMFHSIDAEASPLSFPVSVFRDGLIWLRAHGWRSLTVTEASECLRGMVEAPQHAFAISFDDGYRSVYQAALPVLMDLGYTATLFVNGSDQTNQLPLMEQRPRMTWDEIGDLHEQGFEIGAHSVTHPDLTRLSASQVETELLESRTVIERRTGARPTSLAYPFGFWNRSVREKASQCYRCACTTDLAFATSASDLFALPRLEMHYFRSPRLFRLLTSGLLPLYLTMRRVPRNIRERTLHGTRS